MGKDLSLLTLFDILADDFGPVPHDNKAVLQQDERGCAPVVMSNSQLLPQGLPRVALPTVPVATNQASDVLLAFDTRFQPFRTTVTSESGTVERRMREHGLLKTCCDLLELVDHEMEFVGGASVQYDSYLEQAFKEDEVHRKQITRILKAYGHLPPKFVISKVHFTENFWKIKSDQQWELDEASQIRSIEASGTARRLSDAAKLLLEETCRMLKMFYAYEMSTPPELLAAKSWMDAARKVRLETKQKLDKMYTPMASVCDMASNAANLLEQPAYGNKEHDPPVVRGG